MTTTARPCRWGLMIVMIAAFTAVGLPAFAEDAHEKMNRLNEEGFAEFRAGRYAEAARRFRAAYAAHPDPNLRKNEAVAWFKAERCSEAIPAAQAFLIAPDTSAPDRLEARSIVANCRVEMARQAMRAGSWDLAESLLDEAEALEPDQYARDQIAIARVELAERGTAAKGGGAAARTVVGWSMVGAGAAIVGGTIVYWLLTAPDRERSRTLSPMDPAYEESARRARTSRWLVPVGLSVGGAATGIGIYFVVTGADAGPARPTVGMTYRW